MKPYKLIRNAAENMNKKKFLLNMDLLQNISKKEV